MTGLTAAAAMALAVPRLAAAGIADARREARLLVALALDVEAGTLLTHPERELDTAAGRRLAALVERRAAREPFSRLAGRREFWSLDFALSRDTLDPRPDSETLIEAALDHIRDRRSPLRVVDFGTGTGCLLLALLSELPNAHGFGVDRLPGAAAMARRNAAALGLGERASFLVGSWGDAMVGRADVILANPPYIPSEEIDQLAPEVARHEPRGALDGGADGLVAYRDLAIAMKRLLALQGVGLVEVGAGQAAAVTGILEDFGLAVLTLRRDLAGIERCLVIGASRSPVVGEAKSDN